MHSHWDAAGQTIYLRDQCSWRIPRALFWNAPHQRLWAHFSSVASMKGSTTAGIMVATQLLRCIVPISLPLPPPFSSDTASRASGTPVQKRLWASDRTDAKLLRHVLPHPPRRIRSAHVNKQSLRVPARSCLSRTINAWRPVATGPNRSGPLQSLHPPNIDAIASATIQQPQGQQPKAWLRSVAVRLVWRYTQPDRRFRPFLPRSFVYLPLCLICL